MTDPPVLTPDARPLPCCRAPAIRGRAPELDDGIAALVGDSASPPSAPARSPTRVWRSTAAALGRGHDARPSAASRPGRAPALRYRRRHRRSAVADGGATEKALHRLPTGGWSNAS